MQEEYVTGYLYTPSTGEYVGEYQFAKNKDSNVLHIPPFTTLKRLPRRKLKESNFWKWDGENWISSERVVETQNPTS